MQVRTATAGTEGGLNGSGDGHGIPLTLIKDSEPAISGPRTVRRATKLLVVWSKARMSRRTERGVRVGMTPPRCMEPTFGCGLFAPPPDSIAVHIKLYRLITRNSPTKRGDKRPETAPHSLVRPPSLWSRATLNASPPPPPPLKQPVCLIFPDPY